MNYLGYLRIFPFALRAECLYRHVLFERKEKHYRFIRNILRELCDHHPLAFFGLTIIYERVSRFHRSLYNL